MKGFLEETGSLIKDFWYFLINYIFLIWAHSPIIPLTSDTNFPNLHFPEENKNIRLSLFSFYFGEYAFYFMSWSFSEKNFRLLKKLSLSSLEAFNTDDNSPEFKQKISDFRNHISSLNSADLCIEKEALCRKIENDNARINKSDIKLNIYSAIVLAIISIINFKTFILLHFYLFLLVIIFRPIDTVRNREHRDHHQYRQTHHPLIVFPLHRGQRRHKEKEGNQRLVVGQIRAVGESSPPRTEGRMLHERS